LEFIFLTTVVEKKYTSIWVATICDYYALLTRTRCGYAYAIVRSLVFAYRYILRFFPSNYLLIQNISTSISY